MKTERVSCPICRRRTNEVQQWTKNGFRYVRCGNCGLIYINPQLSDEAVADIYSNVLYEQKSARLDLLLPNLETYKSRLLEKFEKFKKSGCLLDVGCFKGFFLYSASQRGWRAFGTEVSESATRFARTQLGQQVQMGDLLHMTWLEQFRFDVVTFFDVIEHLSRPFLYLKKAHDLLREDGLLYVETPNYNGLPRFVLGKKWTIFHSLHRYYFTPKTMAAMLHEAGFRKIRIRTRGVLPLSTREDEPTCPGVQAGSKLRFLEHLPINWLRNKQEMVESLVFYPLDVLGLSVGTKLVVWARKGA